MRLWSIHPKYLDSKGLVALWREALLAQKVLLNRTRGYKKHPQLDRFRACPEPIEAIGLYLYHIYSEAKKRGYNFNKDKIACLENKPLKIKVSNGQIDFELKHLAEKWKKRNKGKSFKNTGAMPHPLFKKIEGKIEPWEKV